MSKLEAGFKEELGKALDTGFTAEEIDKAKKSWTQQQAVSRAQDNALLGMLSGNEYWGRKLSWQAELEAKVQKLTSEQVNAAWKKYIHKDAISIVKAGDFKKVTP
jgi:zinc protease